MDKKTIGKKARAIGQRFELAVRKDLEKKGWIVAKWTNNVEFEVCTRCDELGNHPKNCKCDIGKLIPAKRKYNPFNKALSIGTGFPDFIALKFINVPELDEYGKDGNGLYDVQGIECKSNGYLDKEEKKKCEWLLNNKIFSKIYIASKGTKRGEIIYKEFI